MDRPVTENGWSRALSLILWATLTATIAGQTVEQPADRQSGLSMIDRSKVFSVELDEASPMGAASIREHSIVWHPQRKKFYLVADVVPLDSPHHPNTYETELHLWSSGDLRSWQYHGVAVRRGRESGAYDRHGVASPAGVVYFDGRLLVAFSARQTASFGKRSIGLAWSGRVPEELPWTKSSAPISDLQGHDDDPALLTTPGDRRLHLYHRIAGPDGYRIVHAWSKHPRNPASWSTAVPVTPRPASVRAQELTAVYQVGRTVHMMVIEHLHAGGIKIAHLASPQPDGPFRAGDAERRYVPSRWQPRRLAYSGHISPVTRDGRMIACFWTVFQDGARYGLIGHPLSVSHLR